MDLRRHRRPRSRDGLVLLATAWAVMLAGCPTGSLDPGTAVDACMDGEFVYYPDVCADGEPDRPCHVRFLMDHAGGAIEVTGVHSGTDVAPWESLHFTGAVFEEGGARGTLGLEFFDEDPVRVDDVTVTLSDAAGCPDRLEVGPFEYTAPSEAAPHPERYVAHRTEPCARRRPACE